MITAIILISLFIIGAAVGSFISVVIYRLHTKKRGIIRGRSACPDCEKPLRTMDLIPIVSYLSLRGSCRYCSKEISYLYPMIEVITGGLFVLLWYMFPFLNEALQFSEAMVGMYLLYSFYVFALIFTFFYDLKYMKVADEVLLPAILVGLIATIAAPLTPNLIDALVGAGIALAFFGAQIILSRGEWLGLGDLRVGALMGVILGWQLTIVALVLSYIIGSFVSLIVIAQKKKIRGVKIPFAPLLVTGTFAAMFFGDAILTWYSSGL